METEPLSETSDFINRLTRLSAGENVTDFFRRESFKTYNMEVVELFSLALNLMEITSEPALRDVRNLAQGWNKSKPKQYSRKTVVELRDTNVATVQNLALCAIDILMTQYAVKKSFHHENKTSVTTEVTGLSMVQFWLCLIKRTDYRTYCEGITPRILNPCTRCRWLVTFTPRPFYPQSKHTGTHWLGGYIRVTAGLDNVRNRNMLPLPGMELRILNSAVRSLVTVETRD